VKRHRPSASVRRHKEDNALGTVFGGVQIPDVVGLSEADHGRELQQKV
jgi:hypothetical protein